MSEENYNGNGQVVDKTLKCKDCGKEFIWTVGEQRFFIEKGFKNKPARCKDCRQQNRQRVDSEFFKVKCAGCGQIGEMQFQPKNPDTVIYCRECFEKKLKTQNSET